MGKCLKGGTDAEHSILSSRHVYKDASAISLNPFYVTTGTVTELRLENRLRYKCMSPGLSFSKSVRSTSLSETWPPLRFSRQFCPAFSAKGAKTCKSVPNDIIRSHSSNNADLNKHLSKPKNAKSYFLHGRNRKESEKQNFSDLMVHVKQFLEKDLPEQGPKSLRVYQYPRNVDVPKEQSILSNQRSRNDIDSELNDKNKDPINPHTAPLLNIFTDKPWFYEEIGECRYLRVRQEALPPIESVFR